MRHLYIVIFSLVLSACGGSGSNSTPPAVPTAGISGTAFDGLIMNGTVKVYDFSTGAKGSLLAQAKTDSQGLYSLSMQIESRPIMVEITGGSYIEEASTNTSRIPVPLTSGLGLTALTNYTTGSSLQIAVTNFTHIAAGLAVYQIKHGKPVASAITDANQTMSTWIGMSISEVIPKDITDIGNVSFYLTPELKYGFLAGAISMWASTHAPIGFVLQSPFNSINLVQIIQQDIQADGLLNGMGLDSLGQPMQLSFGSVPLSADVYRRQFGVALLQMVANANNKTSQTPANLVTFVQSYAANADPIFDNVAPVQVVSTPVVSVTSLTPDQWVNKTITVTASIQDDIGLTSSEFLVDGISTSTSGNNKTPSFVLNTASYADGVHSLSIKSVNGAGFTQTKTIAINVDNTGPASSLTSYLAVYDNRCNMQYATVSICAADIGSGVKSINGIVPDSNNCVVITQSGYVHDFYISVRDNLNNCNAFAATLVGDCAHSGGLVYNYRATGGC
jgi:hypothetical protein